MSEKPKVLLGVPLHPDAGKRLKEAAEVEWMSSDREVLLKVLGSFEGVIAYAPSFDRAVLWEARKLKVISCLSCEGIMLREASEKGIAVLTGVPPESSRDRDLALVEETLRVLSGEKPAFEAGPRGSESPAQTDDAPESGEECLHLAENEKTACSHATAEFVEQEGKKSCLVRFEAGANKPAVVFHFDGLDFSRYLGVSIELENIGESRIAVYGCLNGNNWCAGFEELAPGGTGEMFIDMKRHPEKRFVNACFSGMNGLPDGFMWLWDPVDPSDIRQLRLYLVMPEEQASLRVKSIKPCRPLGIPDNELPDGSFYPFVDEFGQYMHREWPGKARSALDLAAAREREEKDLLEHPGPEGWNRYGGWVSGPKLEATGHFRTEKAGGKWWLVDPEGCLFWSHGMDCVRFQQMTETKGREYYFSSIPQDGDFRSANLAKKYGAGWEEHSRQLAHRRLRSWGMNTLACWSQEDIYNQRKTPYIAWIETRSWLKREFPQVDSPEWAERFQRNMEEVLEKTSDDPWCIGYYVDNEIHGSMDAGKWEKYFELVRYRLKAAAPHKLYMGSRFDFHWYPDMAPEFDAVVKLGARYCDVVSFNLYRYTLKDLTLPEGADKPVIIGEYHIGALDRGLPHTGLRSAKDQRQRARAYYNYVSSCIANKFIVGCGWFQYSDQPYTARPDGENYQIGFVDICDKPYDEIVAASRQIGGQLYQYRMERGEAML
jgi:hypothetical protein